MKSNYSEEQLAVIESNDREISVESPPGSGKTHCILGVVKKHKDDHHLILAFNSTIKDSIKRKIKDESITNAEVFTFHGLAFDYFKDSDQIVSFADRIMVNLDYFTLEQILTKLEIDKKNINQILSALLSFLRGGLSFEKSFLNIDNKIKEDCRNILKYIRTEPTSPMFHEYYIKIFQLMCYSNSKYTTILVDESQDKTNCYEQIIYNMKCKRVIHFGDNQQQIYAYNGAVGMNSSNFR
ncbi:MAG: UvrD-helicase domain-containing protein, partial [Fusobacteriaceae bacterium]